MSLSLSLGLSLRSFFGGGGGGVDPNDYYATVDDAPRNKIIHDTNAAWGGNSATIPLSGTSDAPEGTAIYADVVIDADETVVGSAMQVGTVDDSGDWEGSYTGMVRRPEWLRPRVWVNGSTADKGTTTTILGTGHVIALWGQSEIDNLDAEFYNGSSIETIASDDMVSFHSGTGTHEFAVEGATTNSRHAVMANSLIAARPGEKFAIVLQAASGTGFDKLLDDNSTAPNQRYWSNDKALNDSIGSPVGLIAFSWFASPRNYATQYGAAIHEMVYAKKLDGTPMPAVPFSVDGHALAVAGGGWTADHLLPEIYDYTEGTGTKVAVLEPHRFVASGNIPGCRTGVRNLYAESSEPSLVYGHPVLSYRNNAPSDSAHPAPGEGSERFGVGLVQSAIRAMGLTDWVYPVIDNAYWRPDGSYFELWSASGPITAVDPSYIVGVRVNGALVNAEIVNVADDGAQVDGAIRVYAADVGSGQPFNGNTTVDFATETTGLDYSGDESVEIEGWEHYPLVDVSAPGMPDGVPLANKPDPQILKSTIASNAKFLVSANTMVRDGSDMLAGATQSPLTVRFVWKVDFVVGADAFLAFSTGTAHGVLFELMDTGAIRYNHPYGSGGLQTASGVITNDVYQEIVISMDPATGRVVAWVDGAQVIDRTGDAWTWLIATQKLRLFNISTGDVGAVAEVESITIWKDYTPDGDVSGLAAPYKTIAGDGVSGAAANAASAPTFDWFEDGVKIN